MRKKSRPFTRHPLHLVSVLQHALFNERLPELDDRVVLRQVEGHVGGRAVPVEARQAVHVEEGGLLFALNVASTLQRRAEDVPEVGAIAREGRTPNSSRVLLEVLDAPPFVGV